MQPVVRVVFWEGLAEASATWLDERIYNSQVAEPPSVMEILAVENAALSFDGSGENQRVIPRHLVLGAQLQGLAVKSVRGVNRQKRTKRGRQILLGVRNDHGFGKAAQRQIEEFLTTSVTAQAPTGSGKASVGLPWLAGQLTEDDFFAAA